jgi:hypothetical protein
MRVNAQMFFEKATVQLQVFYPPHARCSVPFLSR